MHGTSSNFIDFLVAVFAMVLMLMSHKLIKSFLDHIFPGGHGHGPGALLSGLMEGVGMAAGRKMFNTGLSALKTGAGMMGAGGIAGAASAMAHMRSSKAFGADGFVGGAFQNDTSAPSPLSDEGLYPGALPPGEGEPMGQCCQLKKKPMICIRRHSRRRVYPSVFHALPLDISALLCYGDMGGCYNEKKRIFF